MVNRAFDNFAIGYEYRSADGVGAGVGVIDGAWIACYLRWLKSGLRLIHF